MTEIVELEKFRSGASRVFSGRDRGAVIREEVSIERLLSCAEGVRIVIPEDVLVVNTSFFLGLLGDTVRLLGEDQFREKVSFVGPIPEEVISDGIDQALREQSPLS